MTNILHLFNVCSVSSLYLLPFRKVDGHDDVLSSMWVGFASRSWLTLLLEHRLSSGSYQERLCSNSQRYHTFANTQSKGEVLLHPLSSTLPVCRLFASFFLLVTTLSTLRKYRFDRHGRFYGSLFTLPSVASFA
jgi:hypothetical protein